MRAGNDISDPEVEEFATLLAERGSRADGSRLNTHFAALRDSREFRDRALPMLVCNREDELAKFAVMLGTSRESAKAALGVVTPYWRPADKLLNALLSKVSHQPLGPDSPFIRLSRHMPRVAAVLDEIRVGIPRDNRAAREDYRAALMHSTTRMTVIGAVGVAVGYNAVGMGIALGYGLVDILARNLRIAQREGRLEKLGL